MPISVAFCFHHESKKLDRVWNLKLFEFGALVSFQKKCFQWEDWQDGRATFPEWNAKDSVMLSCTNRRWDDACLTFVLFLCC